MQIEACRARLYAMESRPFSDETPHTSSAWKESCKRAIIPDVRSIVKVASCLPRIGAI